MKSILLTGYMCVGKTTIGRALAKSLGRTFYDLDWYIEERFHKKISNIFAEEGEQHFRDMERRMLREVAEFEDVVISCGGGTPCFFDNMDYMNRTGLTVYLKATPEVILQHLESSRGERPLLAEKSPEERDAYIRAQLAQREPYYAKAQYIQEITPLEDMKKINLIVEQLKGMLQLSSNGE